MGLPRTFNVQQPSRERLEARLSEEAIAERVGKAVKARRSANIIAVAIPVHLTAPTNG